MYMYPVVVVFNFALYLHLFLSFHLHVHVHVAWEVTSMAAAPPPPKLLDKDRFRVGIKLEALDRRFPYFVCVATVQEKKGKGRYM